MTRAATWAVRIAMFLALLVVALLVLTWIGHEAICGPDRALFVPQC
jgi:hypothetical protein